MIETGFGKDLTDMNRKYRFAPEARGQSDCKPA